MSIYNAAGQTSSGVNYFVTKDHLNSVRDVSTQTGTLSTNCIYDSFGRPSTTNNFTDFQYAGYYFHSRSGINLTLYREYNSLTGRWLSRDPVAESAGLNLYTYVLNEPVSMLDPMGLQGLTFYDPMPFYNLTGVPPSFYGNPSGMGCRSVVDWYVGLPQNGYPESGPNTSCWYGNASANFQDIAKKKCPCNTTPVLFSKQWGGGPNTPSSGRVDTSVPGWDGPGVPPYNYTVFDPGLGVWVGATGRFQGVSYAAGSCPGGAGAPQITCVTCKSNK